MNHYLAYERCVYTRTGVTMHRKLSTYSHWFVAGTLLGGATCASAQTSDPLSAEVRWMYGTIKNNLVKLAEKMPAEDYSFRPTTEVETFGSLAAKGMTRPGRWANSTTFGIINRSR